MTKAKAMAMTKAKAMSMAVATGLATAKATFTGQATPRGKPRLQRKLRPLLLIRSDYCQAASQAAP